MNFQRETYRSKTAIFGRNSGPHDMQVHEPPDDRTHGPTGTRKFPRAIPAHEETTMSKTTSKAKTAKPAGKVRKAKAASPTPVQAQKARDAEKLTAALAPKPTKAKVDQTAAAPDAARSKAVAKSWTNKATAKARTTRHGCRIGREQYASVPEAFRAMGWSLGRMQRVRLIVKREGRAEFEGKVITLVKE